MKRGIAILLTLSLSMIFGVDASKDLETQPQTNSTEMTLDIENVQEIRQMKESLNESFKQARKAKGIPKPNKAQLNPLQKKAAFPFKAIKEKSKKSFKESINIVNKKDIKAKKETYLEKRELLKQKREEFKARAQDKRKRQSTEFIEIEKQKLAELKERAKSKKSKSSLLRNPKVSQIQEQHVRTISRTDNRNSRNGGMEFEFSSVWELYSEFGEVLLSIGDECDGCEGNLGMMDEDDSFDITDSLAFYTWAEEFGFLSYYFQFIDENESGGYDDGEIYAISCEGGNFDAGYEGNMTVAYNGSVYHMIFEDFWMMAYDFNWDGDYEDGPDFSITFDDGTTASYDLHLDDGLLELEGFEGGVYYNVHEATITLSDGTVMEAGSECDSTSRDHGAGRVAWDGQMLTSNVYDSDCNEFAFDVMEPTVDMTEFMSNGGDVDFTQGFYYGIWSGGSSASASLNLESDDEYDSFLEGLVMDFDGNPIADAFVFCIGESASFTDDAGYYHIELESGGIYNLYVEAGGYWIDQTMVEAYEGGTQYDFVLGLEEETALLEIWTGTTDWEAITLAELYSPQSPQELSMSNYDAWDYITVDPSEGFAEVIGEHPEYGGAYLNIEDVEAGNTYERGIYFEEDMQDDSFLEGWVHNWYGEPISGAWVYCENQFGDAYETQSDDEGYYHVEVPYDETAEYEVWVGAENYWEAHDFFPAPDLAYGMGWDWNLGRIDETAQIKGTVYDAETWDLLPYTFLDISCGTGGEPVQLTGFTGEFIFVVDPTDVCEVWAENPDGYEDQTNTVYDLQAGQVQIIEVWLEPDADEEDFTFLGEFDGHEYYFSHFTDTWHNANDTLNQYDEAYLVSITSEEENNFLTDAVTSMTTNALHTGGFLSGYYGPWEWSNGEEWVYENWAEGQPDGSGGVLVFNDQSYGPGEWDDWSGGDSLQFIVEVEGDEDDEFEYLGELDGHEYYLSNFEATWNEANDMFSEWDDAHLVTISSQEENDLITETTGGDVWIGFTDQYEEGYWEWVTGEEVVYTNWGEDEPNNSGDGEHFALINNNGTWNDLHEEMLGFVVEVSDDSDGYVDCACDAEYHVGDRVVLTVDNPGGNDSLFAGATGTVYCGGESPWNAPLLVVWDPPNAGNDVNEYCECGDGDDIDMENSGWWVSCDVIEMDGGDEHGWLEGHIFDQDGNPLQDAAIEGWNEEGGWSTYTDEGGYFSIELSAGYYELEAHMDGFLSQWSDVEIYPGETSYVEFWLEWEEDHTHVYGYVTNVDGEPLEMAQIIAHDPEELGINGMTFADEEGYYGFDLPEDEYVFSIRREGYWVHWSDSYFVSGDDMELSWELESVDEFDGGWEGNIELIGGGGDPESIYFTIFNNEYDVVRILDGPGFYEVPLVNGTYNIYVSASGYESVYMPDAVHIENNVVNLDVQLQYGMVLPPHIEWHGDVPNDQGRQMRLVWNPGMPGDWDFFPFYSIWRLVDEAPMVLWDFIDMVPWHGMDPYSAVVPTLGDSTDMGIHWSTFRVTAHTEDPNEFYDSEPVTGYSIDNLHPGAPNGVQAFTGEEGIVLTWDPPMDEDFGYHRVYRYDLSSEDPAEEFTTVDTFFVDATTSGNYEYWITAVDLNGNESDPSEVVAVMLALEDGLAIPSEFALKQNYPNPFNPSTQIQYALPTDANVSIAIYDLMGRQIRSLVNEQVNAGYHSTLWNATNDMGSPVSAGVYIYTIQAGEFRDVKKMILLK